MNAPTIINAAHEALFRAEDALSVTDVAREINGTTKPNKTQIKAAERLLKELNGLGLIAPEFRTGGVAFYRLIVAPAEVVTHNPHTGALRNPLDVESDPAGALIVNPGEPLKASGDSEGGETDAPVIAKVDANSSARVANFATDEDLQYLAPEDYEMPPADPALLAMANRALHDQVQEFRAQLSSIAETVAPYLPAPSDISTARAVEMMDMLADAQAEHIREQDKTIADLRERLDQQILQWQADTGRLTADLRAAMESRSQTINEATRLRAELAAERQSREALQEQAAGPVGVAGYIVRAAKRKPRTIMNADTAKSAALGAIRAGAQRADVFALVPVGTARLGAEWKDAQ